MEILQIDIGGKMAHFRKYYANNTAMSFCLPPRTSVMGMLGACMGLPKESYHESLASENIRIGIRLLTPIKKQFHRLNFLSIKSKGDVLKGTGDFDGRGGRIQTPFEVLTGLEIAKDEVVYRIYISPNEGGKAVFEQLKKVVSEQQKVYTLCLGVANFTAYIKGFHLFESGQVVELFSEEMTEIHSAIPSKEIKNLNFNKLLPNGHFQSIEEEMSPQDFKADSREVRKMCTLLSSISGHPLSVTLKRSFYQITHLEEVQNILFLE